MPVSDDRCLDKWIRERDKDSFLELVSRHGGMVYGTALRITNSKEMALEIAVACFERLMRMESLPQVPVLIFLHREATRSALEKVKPLPLPTEPINFPTWNDIRNRVDVLIANLTEKYSQPIILHFLEGHAPANLVSYLRLPREKIEERIEKGVEHLKRGLSLLKVNISTTQLMQLLSSNTYEPSPSSLSESISNLLQSYSTIESAQPIKDEKSELAKTSYLVPIFSVIGVFIIFIFSIYLIFRGEKVGSSRNTTDLVQNIHNSNAELPVETGTSSPQTGGNNNIDEETIKKEDSSLKSKEETKAEMVLDLEKKLFELVYSRYVERKNSTQIVMLTSQDFMPTDPFYYYLIALESLGQVDPNWVNQIWDNLFSLGPTAIPENFRLQLSGLGDVFANWRSGALLEKDDFPQPQIPGELSIPIDVFQTLLELVAINILLTPPPYDEHFFQEVQILQRFSLGTYKNAWGELVHIPLHGFECASIVIREMARFKSLPQTSFRDALRMILEMEKAIQDKQTIRYNEYRQIANWVELEFPNLISLRNALKDFLKSTAEKDYIDKLSDAELQKEWDNFLRLPPLDKVSDASYPLEGLRKIIFPADLSIDSHSTHAGITILFSKLVVAVEWFGLENGFYPPSLDFLVPNYLSELKQEVLQQFGVQYMVDANTNLYQIQLPYEAQSLLPWRSANYQ